MEREQKRRDEGKERVIYPASTPYTLILLVGGMLAAYVRNGRWQQNARYADIYSQSENIVLSLDGRDWSLSQHQSDVVD